MATSSGPQWTGDKLDRPENVALFAAQLRRNINGYAELVAAVRRDAEAMWHANPPEGYSTFEAWWRERWVRGPLREIQEHLEKAAALTHALEARYRRGRHEIPAARQAAASGRSRQPAVGPAPRAPQRPQAVPAPEPPTSNFMDMVNERRGRTA